MHNDTLESLQAAIRPCIQCGTCTGSCPNAFAMDFTPRRMWRLVLAGDLDAVFASRTFAVCSACYICTLRCPRGLGLTDAMAALKRMAGRLDVKAFRSSARFYRAFLNSARKNGRVHETGFMSAYFWARKNPVLPFAFAPLGTRLMVKGKVGLAARKATKDANLQALFDKVAQMEADAPKEMP